MVQSSVISFIESRYVCMKMLKSGKFSNCCCLLLLTLVIGFLGVAAVVLSGVLLHKLFIEENFAFIRNQIADLEKQWNESETALNTIQIQITTISSELEIKSRILKFSSAKL